MNGPSVGDIKARLAASIARLADELAPGKPWRDGNRRWSLNPTRADREPNSFVIDIAGPTAGRWTEFAGAGAGGKDHLGGDVIDLISYVRVTHGGMDYQSREARGRAIRWAKDWLGLGDASDASWRAGADARARAAAERARQQEHASKAERDRKAARAKAWWIEQAKWPRTLVQTYLEVARGLPVGALASPFNALRFAPDLMADRDTGELCPAMMAAMTDGKGRIRAVHRTFLADDGRSKADVTKAKKMWGDAKGTMIRLHRGQSGLSETAACEQGVTGETLAVSEGIEDAISWTCLEPADRTAAAGDINKLAHIPIPACVGTIRILADNDPGGSQAADAFEHVAERLRQRAAGRAVIVQRPPAGFKDFNDYWRSIR